MAVKGIIFQPKMVGSFAAVSPSNTIPKPPEIVIPGTGTVIEREAKLFCEQESPVPIFIRRRPKEWEYVGEYKVDHFSIEPAEIARHHKGSITPLNQVTRVIFLKRAAK